MVRASRAGALLAVAARLLLPLVGALLLLSPDAIQPADVDAGGGRDVAASLRQQQQRAEASMLRADRQIKRLQRERGRHDARLRAAKRQLERAIERRDAARRTYERREARLDTAEVVLARAVRVRPDPSGRQLTDRPALRKRLGKLERQVHEQARKLRTLEREVKRARERKQSRSTKVGKARIEARKAERERAEDRLGRAITQLLEVAQARASQHFEPASLTGFHKPARGRISQGYGCTGYRTNPRRGTCRHFHDGIDIAAPRGTLVRASADGYVAYVGRNPWDQGSRAYVVIIGHAAGYETIYGHLQPRRLVHAGQRVRRGDPIGRIGMTGRSTGPHVHWEVSRSFQTVHPLHARHR